MKNFLIILFFILLSFQSSANQDYPTRPIRFLVGAAPGGGGDTSARILQDSLAQHLKMNVIIDNRSSAGGMLAREIMNNSTNYGYTIYFISASQVINSILTHGDAISNSNILLISTVSKQSYVLAVNPKSEVTRVQDLIDLAKKNPNKITYGSFGVGTLNHLAGLILSQKANVNFLHIPYKGSTAAVQDLLGNQISFVFSSGSAVISHIQTNRLRAIAVSSSTRTSILPNVPTVEESGIKDFNVIGWYGITVHKKTDKEIISKLSNVINLVLQDSKIISKFNGIGSDVWISNTKQAQSILKQTEDRYKGIIDRNSF